MAEQRYLSIQEVATRFGVNATTVYHLARRGRLPSFKIGNQWRFSQDMLDRWVAEQVSGGHRALGPRARQRVKARSTPSQSPC